MKSPAVLVASLLLAAASAHADDSMTGSYDIKLEEMANNCSPPPIAFRAATLRLEIKGKSLTVNIETIPQMAGVGKIN